MAILSTGFVCFTGSNIGPTKPNHPWTNGQVERRNRTLKDATVKRSFYDTHNQLKELLTDFLRAYNFARRLKTLKGIAPYEYLCKLWTQTPHTFTLNPTHQMPGTNRYLWARDYDREMSDVLEIQSLISDAITHEVRAALPNSRPGPAKESQINQAAYDAYLRGLQNSNQRSKPGATAAIGEFLQATSDDPQYAAA